MKKLNNGSYEVRLVLSEEFARYAQENFERFSFLSPEDYLNGILNTAMLAEIPAPQRDRNDPGAPDMNDGFPL